VKQSVEVMDKLDATAILKKLETANMEDMIWALRFIADKLNEKEKTKSNMLISRCFKEVVARMSDSTLNSRGGYHGKKV